MTEEILCAYERINELEGVLAGVLRHIAVLDYLDASTINAVADRLGEVLADKVVM